MTNPYTPPQNDGEPVPVGAPPRTGPSGATLEMAFELTEADFIEYQYCHAKRTGSNGSKALRAIGTMMGVAAVPGVMDGDWAVATISCLVFGATFLGFGLWLGSRAQLGQAVRKMVSSPRGCLAIDKWTIVVSPEGASFTNSTSRGEHSWQAINLVVDEPQHVLLYTSAASALIIPKRAADPRLVHDVNHYLALDRWRRNEPAAAPVGNKRQKASTVALLWVLLIVIFSLFWLLLAPGE